VALERGAKERDLRIGRARLASSPIGRWDLTFEGGPFILQESSIELGEGWVQRALKESGAVCLGREGKVWLAETSSLTVDRTCSTDKAHCSHTMLMRDHGLKGGNADLGRQYGYRG